MSRTLRSRMAAVLALAFTLLAVGTAEAQTRRRVPNRGFRPGVSNPAFRVPNTPRAFNPNFPRPGLPGQGFYGYNPTPVAGGTFVPGWGVNNGFARPTPVAGGMYVPGYGVNNGFARPTPVAGGMYTPGMGVTGPNVGNTPVQGGTHVPGLGVVGGVR